VPAFLCGITAVALSGHRGAKYFFRAARAAEQSSGIAQSIAGVPSDDLARDCAKVAFSLDSLCSEYQELSEKFSHPALEGEDKTSIATAVSRLCTEHVKASASAFPSGVSPLAKLSGLDPAGEMQRAPETALSVKDRGNEVYKAGDFSAALRIYETVLSRFPDACAQASLLLSNISACYLSLSTSASSSPKIEETSGIPFVVLATIYACIALLLNPRNEKAHIRHARSLVAMMGTGRNLKKHPLQPDVVGALAAAKLFCHATGQIADDLLQISRQVS
jgi:hypothetical protein